MTKDDIKNRTNKVIGELVTEQASKKVTNPLDITYNEEFTKAINILGEEVQVIINKEDIAEKTPLVVINYLNERAEIVAKEREAKYETATIAERAQFNGYIMAISVIDKEFRSIMSEFAAIKARKLQA